MIQRMYNILVILLLSFLIPLFPVPVYAFELDCFVVGSVNGGIPEKLNVFYLRKGDQLTLFPVVKYEGRWYADVGVFNSNGKMVQVDRRLDQVKMDWYRITPVLKEYDNLERLSRSGENMDPIHYTVSPAASAANFRFPFHLQTEKPGTYYVTPSVHWQGQTLQSIKQTRFTSIVPLQEVYPAQVVRIAYREDDTYFGYLSELFQTPFILGPRITPGGFHQTDAGMGSDCAAFAIYGRRRQGYDIPYCGPLRISQYLQPLYDSPVSPLHAGSSVYVDAEHKPVKTGAGGLCPGDIVHFGEQVSVFYRDQGIIGFLDKDDLIIQSYGSEPHITTLEKSGFYHLPVLLYRWEN